MDETADIWALGVTFYFLLTYEYPFNNNAKNVRELNEIYLKNELDLSKFDDDNLKHVMRRMLEKDPLKRATVEELLQSDWVTNNGE